MIGRRRRRKDESSASTATAAAAADRSRGRLPSLLLQTLIDFGKKGKSRSERTPGVEAVDVVAVAMFVIEFVIVVVVID